MRMLLIDNDDSFTYNLFQQIKECSPDTKIDVWRRNSLREQRKLSGYDKLIISPGPGHPAEAVELYALLQRLQGRLPILGICLGHQVIARFYGAEIKPLSHPAHGVASKIYINEYSVLCKELYPSFVAGRYHSWVVEENNFPAQLKITAIDDEGTVMALKHVFLPIFGVQFHPESYLTKKGHVLMSAFLEL